MRILLVEDNRDILANLADYLGLKGYTVDCAQDVGERGLCGSVARVVEPAARKPKFQDLELGESIEQDLREDGEGRDARVDVERGKRRQGVRVVQELEKGALRGKRGVEWVGDGD